MVNVPAMHFDIVERPPPRPDRMRQHAHQREREVKSAERDPLPLAMPLREMRQINLANRSPSRRPHRRCQRGGRQHQPGEDGQRDTARMHQKERHPLSGHAAGRCGRRSAKSVTLFGPLVRHAFQNRFMRIAILLVTALVAWRAGALRAATIRGVVVEDATGHPLARALIVAHPVAGATAEMRSVRSDSNGRFELAGLPPGAYLLLASRRGFAPVPYGQKQGKGSGVPLEVGENSEASVEIRLPRYGAISGAVLDENDVGLPDCEVIAYRDSHPPAPAAHATTDD